MILIKKTLSNGYFHASFDSKNAHSHICTIINEKLSGSFHYSYFDKSKINSSVHTTNEKINLSNLGLTALEIYNSYENVHLIIEGRNDFDQHKAEALINKWQNQLDFLTYNQPSLITYYPDIKVNVSGKKNPGLQVVDFLLWVLNRSVMSKPDDTWKSRLKLEDYSNHAQQGGPESGGDFYINQSMTIKGRLNYPYIIFESENIEEFYQSYITIECTLRQLVGTDFPEHAKHLYPKLKKLNSDFFSTLRAIDDKILSEISSLFIRLFDTLPIYKSLHDSDEKSWILLLKAKKMAGLFLRRDLSHGVRSSKEILRRRNQIIDANPEILSG